MRSEPRSARTPVWALPISLAATLGIDFSFFSSGYLDVSVRRVPSCMPMYSAYGDGGFLHRVSPFRYLRIVACLRLPAAFRSLSRLSSAPGAKASAPRPFLLNRQLFSLGFFPKSTCFSLFTSSVTLLRVLSSRI